MNTRGHLSHRETHISSSHAGVRRGRDGRAPPREYTRARAARQNARKKTRTKRYQIRVSKLVRHYTTIEGMHSSPRTQTPTTEPPGAPDHYRCRNRQASIDRKGETRRPTYIDKTAWRQRTYINTVSAYYLFWLR